MKCNEVMRRLWPAPPVQGAGANAFSARSQTLRLAAFVACALVATLGVGSLLTTKLRSLGEEAARSQFLTLATVAAAGFNDADVTTLKQCLKSGQSPANCNALQKLRQIKKENAGFRFVYLMEQIDGQVVFLADAEPASSTTFSPSGQPYKEASPELREAFDTGKGFVEGPMRDSWGDWVSSHAPILDRDTGKVIALLGLDIDAGDWRNQVSRYGRLGMLLIVAVVVVLMVLALYSYRLIWLNEARVREIAKRVRIEQGLVAAKNKLTAMAQELEGACQQIEADRIDLRIANEQLLASQQELRKSEEKHRKLTENITDIITLIDSDGQIVYVSPSLSRVLGYRPEEQIGKSIFDSIHPEDRAQVLALFQERLLKPDGIASIEIRYRHNDGSWRVLESRAKNLLEDPTFRGAIITSRDISERIQAEKDIRAAQKMLENVLETIPVSVFWKDRDLRYLGCNSQFARQAGLPDPAAIVGKDDTELPWASCSPCHGQDRAVLLSEEQQLGQEAPWDTAHGQLWLRRNIVPLRDPEGLLVGVLGTYEDISKERHLESQLRQAQRLEALGTLAGGIASDFNNILGAVLGYAELALDDLPPDLFKGRSFVKEIQSSAKRASDLVQQILKFSRKAKQERRPVNLGNLIADVTRTFITLVPPTIKIHQCIGLESAVVLADAGQMHQALTNLCLNSMHAMEERGGDLTIGLKLVAEGLPDGSQNPESRPCVCLEVSDTGHGMNARTMERIFEPYFTTKPERVSSGLGLATVYGIVKSHEGSIDVTSEVGKGTTVRIFLPCTIDTVSKDVLKFSKAGTPAGEHVLLVDDDELMLGAVTLLLQRMDYQVTAVSEPGLALECFRQAPEEFDLVLTDNAMPGMTGLALAEAILAVRPGCPVVLSSGMGEPATRSKAHAIGIRATLDKPVKRETLASVIRTALA